MKEQEIRDLLNAGRSGQAWGLRQAITIAVTEETHENTGYSEDYKRGWEDACGVILKQLKALYDQADPKPIG
jgi:adenosyl cobinamide kinase/adenosyl cobinamide phosphate guanylyltransferase